MAKRSSCSQVVPILLWGVNPFPFLQAGTTLLFCTKQFNLPSLISSQEFWSSQLPPWSFANFRNLRNPKCVCVICVQCQPNHQQPGNNCFFGHWNTLAGSEGLTWFIYIKKKKRVVQYHLNASHRHRRPNWKLWWFVARFSVRRASINKP